MPERTKCRTIWWQCSILSKPSTGWTKFPVCVHFQSLHNIWTLKKRPISFTDLCVYTGANVMLSGTKNRAANVGECWVSQVGKERDWVHMASIILSCHKLTESHQKEYPMEKCIIKSECFYFFTKYSYILYITCNNCSHSVKYLYTIIIKYSFWKELI